MQKLLYILFVFYCSCENVNQKMHTPVKFLNHTIVKNNDYAKDSVLFIKQLKYKLINREGFFNNTAYFDSTQLIVDSIIYSPDIKKMAVLVITKNPTLRQVMPNKMHKWYYDGTCYLGIKKDDTVNVNWIGPSFTNSYDRYELSVILRDYYFTKFATKDSFYAYNINDIRFWDCAIWRKFDVEETRKKSFEEEKRNHPENVYEPGK